MTSAPALRRTALFPFDCVIAGSACVQSQSRFDPPGKRSGLTAPGLGSSTSTNIRRFDDEAATWDDDPGHEEAAGGGGPGHRGGREPHGPRMRALDVGGGTGRLSILLADRVGSVVVTDPSAGMVQVARERIEAAGLSDRLRADFSERRGDPFASAND